jgi:GalNAc-alpha-(1->4)-GalNAc-alpha-(1->3)-diNAcBac-PP-undecaprenol alpha-1,4-N-acetyl-D-galactosaminyltransferase
MRLTLVISQLGAGGAERVMSTLASYWADHGQDVTLITFWSTSSDLYSLSPGVKRVALGLAHPSTNLRQSPRLTWRRLWALRRQIRWRRPDVVISFMDTTNMVTLLASRGLGVPVIVSERIHPAYHDIGALRSWLRRRVYPWADAIVIPSENIRPWMASIVPRGMVRVIPNPVRPATGRVAGRLADRSGEHVVVGMGRLDPQKQFDYLLRAFARCGGHHADWSLVVMGEGPERKNLEALAAQLGIAGRVRWTSVVAEPEEVLRRADFFVLSSRYEGFPNALLEAMACGLPVVSFDCPSGPREIIRHEIDGLLVPSQDLDALTAAVDRLMSNGTERQRLGARAREVTERFGLERVMAMWEDLLRALGRDMGARN